MPPIPDPHTKVPMMFRAQVAGRSQLQRIERDQELDAERWVSEWTERTYPEPPQFVAPVQTRAYEMSWRFITNGGQDDGIIRPVIGAKGWPFYPGSSMKGVFRSACTPDQAKRYCGSKTGDRDVEPGILRFHGGYPTSTDWTENLLDITHPQQTRQVQDSSRTAAFALISLDRPELAFGISSTETLSASEWETVWQIWERAIAQGIGSRVCAGYGQPAQVEGDVLYRCDLQGTGQAAKLLSGGAEFRPNIFRAAIRGHAMRIFGGLTDGETAMGLVNELFGSVAGNGDVGYVTMAFVAEHTPNLEAFGQGSYRAMVYDVAGQLRWMLARSLPQDDRRALVALIKALTQFAMVFGGFGKSWRRADHRMFYADYYDQGYKPMIGCHWQWNSQASRVNDSRVRKLEKAGEFIDQVRDTAREWMRRRGASPTTQGADWREAWHPDRVQVWGRVAFNAEESEVIPWLHGPYREGDRMVAEGKIKETELTGQLGQIGRLWHRMYPCVRVQRPPEVKRPTLDQFQVRTLPRYFEFLTLFPDDSSTTDDFLTFLATQPGDFQKLWPRPNHLR